MITELKPIRKRATQVELSHKELEIIQRFLFRSLVEVMQELNTYREVPHHDAFYKEAKAERETIIRLQMKIDSAVLDA